ncbi:MAG: uroporphyrinogen decarboxylase (URO-D) [Lachnospiraceae bacterium]|nr:uroporphyrinogen decarboxylase (URO-D) [Lachnospiraceae bacterium]
MLTPKENLMELLKPNGKPDRLMMDYEFCVPVMNDPLVRFCRGNRIKGKTTKDQWGTTYMWPEEQLFAFPSEQDLVCEDVTQWKETVHVPDLVANCSEESLWEDCRAAAAKVDRSEKLVTSVMGTGVFEQAHNLMGVSNACMNFLLEPDDMLELLEAIGEYRFQYTKLLVDMLHPDLIISHDDWGSKNTLFISPDTWREFIRPQYKKMYDYMKEHGVIIMHHSDSYCEPLVEDMVEMGIDIWQGVLNTNNIPAIQEKLQGRMVLMGGIDSVIDRADSTEEEIRAEVRHVCETYGPGGHFIPSITYGGPGTLFPHVQPIINDEINRYNLETYGIGY